MDIVIKNISICKFCRNFVNGKCTMQPYYECNNRE